jgi:hypothetical protein
MKTLAVRKHVVSLLLVLLVIAAPAGLAAPLQTGFRIAYDVSHGGLHLGTSDRQLLPSGEGQWEFTARTKATGLSALFLGDIIEERSRLQISADRIQPLSYHYHRHGGRKEQRYQLAYDEATQQLHFVHRDQHALAASGYQDPLSFLIAVMHQLGQGKQTFVLPIAGRKSLDDYRFRVLAETDLTSPLGRLDVVHVRAQKPGQDDYYELWCAPALDYLPVHVRYTDDGQETDLHLSRYTELPITTNNAATADPYAAADNT